MSPINLYLEIDNIDNDFSRIYLWAIANSLTLNPVKTKAIVTFKISI